MARSLKQTPFRGFGYWASLVAQAVLYVAAGINHFWHPATYVQIMPRWAPAPGLLVQLSGIAEIALGVLLVPRATRRLAAWGLVALLLAVFPANIQMALDWHRTGHPLEWIAWLRLPLQIPLLLWAYAFTRPAVGRPTK